MSRSARLSLINSSDEQVPVKQQCQWLGISRSSYYYRPSGIPEADHRAMRVLDELYLEDPTRGTRRMCKELRKLGFTIGRSHTRKLMQRMRLRTIYCRPRTTCIDPAAYKFPYLLRNLEITRCNQVWAADITYLPMARGYMYLFAIMDVKSRFIVGWSLSNTMDTDWIIKTISKAVNRYGAPDILNTDQGSQFTSEAYVNYVKQLRHTQISMDGKGRAIDNIFIERFWRTIKHEKIYLVRPENGHQAERACKEFIDYYNSRRDHSSLGDEKPEKVYFNAA
jgi:putative transposase